MPTYRFEAMTSSGEEVVDVIEADDKQAAQQLLSRQGLFVTKLAEAPGGSRPLTTNVAPRGRTRQAAMSPARGAQRKPIPQVVFVFFGLAGLVSTLVGGWLGCSAWSRVAGAQRVEGRVVEIVRERVHAADGESEAVRAIVEYRVNDQPYRIPSQGGHTGSMKGERIPVLVRPDRPADGVIDSFSEKWMPALIVGGVGVVFLLFTTIAFWSRARSSS